ncbi:hypothetical protein [Rufibacter roseus]|uniref:Uncharacterized protein n=1 Tax=Rufibacter roseus TaxID=1567108 RepID=A0ABW2DQI9_9BACT|nr:hypothetical protein [Rufibacter roseus]
MKIIPYIIAKDIFIWILYFMILRFDIGGAFTPEVASHFPFAQILTFSEVLAGAVYIALIPLLIDLIFTTRLNSSLSKRENWQQMNDFKKGVILHIPITTLWLLFSITGIVESNQSSTMALCGGFLASGIILILTNKLQNTLCPTLTN